MKKEDVIFSEKKFLNLPGHSGMANIVAHVVLEESYGTNKELYRRIYAHLGIADCDRKVDFMIEFEDEYSRENSLHKVDTLIEVLKDFRKALNKECRIQEKFEKKRKLKEEKEDAEKKIKEVVEKI